MKLISIEKIDKENKNNYIEMLKHLIDGTLKVRFLKYNEKLS